MSAVKLFGLKRCSTCVKAIKWLEEHQVESTFIDYRDEPIAPEQLVAWAPEVGGWEKLVNRASMTWRNLPTERKDPASDEQWLALIKEFPTVVKRPVMVRGDGAVSVGFSDKKYSELLG